MARYLFVFVLLQGFLYEISLQDFVPRNFDDYDEFWTSILRDTCAGFINGGCEHFCSDIGKIIQCSCLPGYRLHDDGKHCEVLKGFCEKLHRPANGKMECESEPVAVGKSCKFTCNEGYVLLGSGNRICLEEPKDSFPEWSGGPTLCNHISRTRVIRRVTCSFRNGGCEHTCSEIGNAIQCSCLPGYRLHDDGNHCEVNSCPAFSKPPFSIIKCENGNLGLSKMNRYPFDTVCEVTCDIGFIYFGSTNMKCQEDGTWKGTLADCKHECVKDNGGCDQKCINTSGSYRCFNVCSSGYKWDVSSKKCIDIDECKNEFLKPCDSDHVCINTEGSYSCLCKPGYVLIENRKCQGCRKGTYWSPEEHGCVDCPTNSFTLSEGMTSVSDCVCRPGFTGSPEHNIPCEDINECAENNFGCSYECVNIPGDAFCYCPVGYETDNDKKTCIDINECSLKNGGCEGLCHNTEGSFRCSCPTGFRTSNKDIYTCEAQSCHPLKVPEHGDVHPPSCSTDGNTVNQTCTFTCHQGYTRLKGLAVFECQNNLTWKQSITDIPVCEREMPPPLKMELLHCSLGFLLFIGLQFASSDEEPPEFISCPNDILIENAKVDGEIVTWKEPMVVDNVGVEFLKSSVEPNSILKPGSYHVEYIARDGAGNTKSCLFKIDIVLECPPLTPWSPTTRKCEENTS